MNYETKHRHITVKFNQAEYDSLQRCAIAAYGSPKMESITKFIELIMRDVITDEMADNQAA